MLPPTFILGILLLPGPCAASQKDPDSSNVTLQALSNRAIADGLPNRVPGPIAELLELPPDAPVHQLKVSKDQTSDETIHLLKVMVELSTTTPPVPLRPLGVVFFADRVDGKRSETYWYYAGLEGTLRKAIRIEAATDEAGKPIKGSGMANKVDVASPEIRDRFKHELDLWLRKTFLKKQWRSAEFSGGVLKKKGKAP